MPVKLLLGSLSTLEASTFIFPQARADQARQDEHRSTGSPAEALLIDTTFYIFRYPDSVRCWPYHLSQAQSSVLAVVMIVATWTMPCNEAI